MSADMADLDARLSDFDARADRLRATLNGHDQTGPAPPPPANPPPANSAPAFLHHSSFVRDAPLPTYPVDVWPESIAIYIAAVARSVDAPADMLGVPLAAIAGAVVGNRRSLLLKPGYVLRPSLWALVVAESTTGKSPMLDCGLALVAAPQAAAVADYRAAVEAYEAELALRKAAKDATPLPRPVLAHYFTTNATMEWFAPAARDSPGIVMARDELLGWFRDMDAYRGGKGGDRQSWLSLWSGGALKVDRRGADTVYAEHPVVCVAGGIQPGRFPELAADAETDGFLARFLISIPEARIPGWTEEAVPEEAVAAAADLVDRLRLPAPAPPLPLSDAARAAFRAWHELNAAEIEAAPELLRPAFGKLPAQAGKLALVLHACHDPDARLPALPPERMDDALRLAEYHRAHAVRAYEMLGDFRGGVVGLSRRVLAALERSGGEATRTELHAALGGHVSAADLSAALDDARDRGLVEVDQVATGGRPSDVYRLVRASVGERTKDDEESPGTGGGQFSGASLDADLRCGKPAICRRLGPCPSAQQHGMCPLGAGPGPRA